jgi:hypothetical protein
MSYLTRCNHCSLKDIRHRAKQDGMKVTLFKGVDFGLGGGVRCFVHPPDVKPVNEDESPYSVAWFMALPDRCEC